MNSEREVLVSIVAETEVQELPKTHSVCGVDVGIKDFATLSDGTVCSNPKFFCTLEEKLAKAQSILSRRTKGGANRKKQRIKVARIHSSLNCWNGRDRLIHIRSIERSS